MHSSCWVISLLKSDLAEKIRFLAKLYKHIFVADLSFLPKAHSAFKVVMVLRIGLIFILEGNDSHWVLQ